ncbi:hypothetical protein ADK86_21525 [Streptomyces sp. NRRL F-5755]|nr:hypothetical protein ADK86_21525 [Streptomyces sp. NRRL F-5755]
MKMTTALASSAMLAAALLGAGGATQAFAAPADPAAQTWTHSVQNDAHNTNIDAYYGTGVVTRTADYVYQVWKGTRVGKTEAGVGVYTIKPVVPPSPVGYGGKCLTFNGENVQVTLEKCVDGQVNQRWIVNTALDKTSIIPEKARDLRLQAEAGDAIPLKPQKVDDGADQSWMLYDKD